MTKPDQYKACVLGNSLGGLTAAALLQSKGYPTVVLEPLNEPIEHDSSEFLTGFMLKPLLKRVGYHPSQLTHITTLDVPFQWIDQEKRLSWFTDDDRFRVELARELPESSQKLQELFTHDPEAMNIYKHLLNSRVHLPPEGFFSRRQFFKILQAVVKIEHIDALKTKDWYSQVALGENLQELISICQLGLTSLESPVSTRAQMAHFLYSLRWEGHTTMGGLRKIKEMLKEKFVALGGKIFAFEKINSLSWSGSHLNAIQFKKLGEEARVAFDHIVIAGDPMGLIACDDHKALNRWKKEIHRDCTRIGVRATKNFVIPTELIPVGFRTQGMFFWQPEKSEQKEKRKFPRVVRFVLSQLNADQSNLALSYFVNPIGKTPLSEVFDAEIEEILTEIFPFFESKNQSHVPWLIPDVNGSAGAFSEPYVYYLDSKSGPWIETTSVKCPIKNGFYAGKMIMPELGLDGEILAGMHVSNEISAY